jgi:hypothetical protein
MTWEAMSNQSAAANRCQSSRLTRMDNLIINSAFHARCPAVAEPGSLSI